MTTYDFSMKYVMCFWNRMRGILKKYVKGVSSRGEGGSATWDDGPNVVFF